MANILIIASTKSILQKKRGLAGLQDGHNLIWYTHGELSGKNRIRIINSLPRRVQNKIIRKLLYLIEPIYIYYLTKKYSIDLIHVHWANRIFIPLGFPSKTPVVLTVMGGDILPEQSYRGFLNKFMVKIMILKSNIITSKSSYMDDALNNINSNTSKKIIRITWGVDTDKFRSNIDAEWLRKKYSLKKEQMIFFDMRNAKPLYQKEIIIQAFAKISNIIDSVLLVSERVGDQEYLDSLYSLVNDLRIKDNVRFLGTLSQDEMPYIYNLSHIGISIPKSDGMPQSLFEMMACGTYPILGDLKQYKSLFQNNNGATFIPLGSRESTIDALSEAMLETTKKPKMLKKTALENRSRVLKVANEKTQLRLVNNLYKKLIENNN